MLPLQGLTVVDLSTVVFGPLARQILADYGATVIKVESPVGDSTRRTGLCLAGTAGRAVLSHLCTHGKGSYVAKRLLAGHDIGG